VVQRAGRAGLRRHRDRHGDGAGAARQPAAAPLSPPRRPRAAEPHGLQQPGRAGRRGAAEADTDRARAGINIGKSKAAPLEDAAADYLRSLELLEPFAAYLVVNVSSPNTPGLRQLQDAAPLRELLRALRTRGGELAAARGTPPRPILLKIAPDLSDPQVEEAAGIAVEEGMAGLIATNTTVSREGLRTPGVDGMGAGGISGAPVHRRAVEVVRRAWTATGGRLPIVGVGGIFGADEAWAMVRAGASLVQVWTGFIYQGPGIARDINRGLLERMAREGFGSLDEAVGAAHR
jgi:dihydroorotate dehydrogenase